MTTTRQSFLILGLSYALGALSLTSIGIIVPFMGALAARLHSSLAGMGFAIALFSAPSALLATAGGAVIDRFGLRRSLVASGFIAVLSDGVASTARSAVAFDCAMLLGGVALGGIVIAVPALLLTLQGQARLRALTFWPTHAPSGYSLGLLLAAAFSIDGGWQRALTLHAVTMCVVTLGCLGLPRVAVASVRIPQRTPWTAVGKVLRNRRIWRLGVALAMPNGIAYGTSLVAPSYLARMHDLSLAQSSTTVACAKIAAMVTGGVVTGQMLAGNANMRHLFWSMAAAGFIAQCALYSPASSVGLATVALMTWLFAFGGMTGSCMAQLASVIEDERTATASGVVNQFISVTSLAAPITYFSAPGAWGYILLAAVGLSISVLAVPGEPGAGYAARPHASR